VAEDSKRPSCDPQQEGHAEKQKEGKILAAKWNSGVPRGDREGAGFSKPDTGGKASRLKL